MKDSYEVEVKSLLGNQESADRLRARMMELDPSCVMTASSSQLNHYFEGGDLHELARVFAPLVSEETAKKMERIATEGKSVSIRTRQVGDGFGRVVLKASVGDDSSANGVARIEIEELIEGKSLAELDEIVKSAGFTYQAKWSRAREEYVSGPVTVCLDKNAGYGYLAEFERVVESADEIPSARADIDAFMEKLGVTELPQDRLERMFAHYNLHWPEYYGTDHIFVID